MTPDTIVSRMARRFGREWRRRAPGSTAARMARLERTSGGRLHVAARDLAGGRTVGHRADEPAPMASTVKVPLTIAVLWRAARREIDLDAPIALDRRHFRPGRGRLAADRAHGAPPTLDLRSLLRLAIVESDNTATDLLFGAAGGPAAVQRHVHDLGIHGMRVDRTMLDLLSDRRGVGRWSADAFDLDAWDAARAAVPPDDAEAARRAAVAEVRDTSTPHAMADLLAALHAGSALPDAETSSLLAAMAACRTGGRRIRAGVPPGATTRSKSGTVEGVVICDIALVTTPDARTTAIAAYLVDAAVSAAEQDALLADATWLALRDLTSR